FSVLNHPGVMPICGVGPDNKRVSYSEKGGNLWLCGYTGSGDTLSLNNIPVNAEDREEFINNYLTRKIENNPLNVLGLPTTDISLSHGGNPQKIYDPEELIQYSAGCNSFIHSRQHIDFGATDILIREREGADCDRDPMTSNTTFNLTWPPGATTSYARFFGGTSGASPVVAGVAALVRGANPDLTWRDTKIILADSASAPPVRRSCKGGAKYSDPTANYCHDENYGFGIVNAEESVILAMDIGFTNRTSDCPDLADGFTFGAASFLGMEANGDWELQVVDNTTKNRLPVKWRMIFYGHNKE
ncbi:MAG: S8 family serine peptidase, partial [Candidatus Portiera sp.]|nr:S8 family serine peptidase [Portiera sp.]